MKIKINKSVTARAEGNRESSRFSFCRHPEFISGSSRFNGKDKMLKQVQHDGVGVGAFTLIELTARQGMKGYMLLERIVRQRTDLSHPTSIPSPLEGESLSRSVSVRECRRAGEGEQMKKSFFIDPLIRALPTFSREGRRNRYCKAFTLIELLVVVLIIGILAAVAVPQYQKAVEKARYMQLLTIGRSLLEAQKRYYLANNQYADSFDVLDVLPQGQVNQRSIQNNKFFCAFNGIYPEFICYNTQNTSLELLVFYNKQQYGAQSIICRADGNKDADKQVCLSLGGVVATENDYYTDYILYSEH